MQTTQKVPTWQILSDDGKNYRWVSSGTDSATTTEEPPSLVIPIENPKSRLPSMTDVLIQGSSKLLKNSGSSNEDYPMFRTGLGKSVEIKKSSILKALSVLGENDSPDGDKVFGAANDHSFSNSLFQTASGKAVNISSAGLTRAKTLLGLEGKPNNFTTSESDAWGNSQHLDVGVEGHTNGFVNYRDTTTGTVGYPTNSHTPVHQSEKEAVQNFMGSEMCKPSSKPPEIKFQTAGGRSISVSKDALERAKTLLGDTEIGGLPNEESTDCQMFSFFKGNRFDETSLNKENDPYESCLPLNLTTSRFTSNGFPPPRVPLSKHKQFSANLEGSFTGNNSLKLVDENDSLYNGFSKTNSSIPCVQSQRRNTGAPHKVLSSAGKDIGSRVNPMGRPLVDISNNIGTGYSRNSLAKNIDSKANPVGRPPIAPLIDIPSNTRVASANQKQVTSEKRKLGRRSSVSPFKRPRISRFSTPLDSNMSFLPKGLE